MPIVSGSGAPFTGGTVPNPTTFTSAVTLAASEPALALANAFAFLIAAQNLTLTDTAADAGTGNGLAWLFNGGDGNQSLRITVGSSGQFQHFFVQDGSVSLAGPLATTPTAPQTLTLTSGVGSQAAVSADTHFYTPVTFNALAGDATCAVAVSSDNATYHALGTITHKAGLANGEVELVAVFVPAGWYLKLTVANATIGTTTYY